jgi:hypothetical protein
LGGFAWSATSASAARAGAHIKGNDVGQFRDVSTQVVVAPAEYKSGEMIYPYANAK